MALQKTSDSKTTTLNVVSSEEELDMTLRPEDMAVITGLLTKLYHNPLEAMIRESVSNAIDATELLPESQRKPVQVNGPTVLNPTVTIVDFGIGMSLETVKSIYRFYAASTKKNDFSQIGAYGLGAKAPLAYTDTFTVQTTHDGFTTDFVVSRNTGVNSLTIIGHEYTGQENGTTVTIPVLSHDTAAANDIIEKYRHLPTASVQIAANGSNNDDNYILVGEVVLDDETSTKGRIWVSSNAHAYEIDCRQSAFTLLLGGWGYSSITSSWGRREYNTIVVELKPGVVDFDSSRDYITENRRLVQLRTKVAQQVTEMMPQIVNSFANAIEPNKFLHRFIYRVSLQGDGKVNFPTTKAPIEPSAFTRADGMNYLDYTLDHTKGSKVNSTVHLKWVDNEDKVYRSGGAIEVHPKYGFTIRSGNEAAPHKAQASKELLEAIVYSFGGEHNVNVGLGYALCVSSKRGQVGREIAVQVTSTEEAELLGKAFSSIRSADNISGIHMMSKLPEEAERKALAEFYPVDFTDAASLVKKIKDAHKIRLAARTHEANKVMQNLSGNVQKFADMSNLEILFGDTSPIVRLQQTMTLSEAVEQGKYVFVVNKSYATGAVMWLRNNGVVDLSNKEFLVISTANMVVADWNALLEYDKAFTTATYNNLSRKSAAAKKFIEARYRYAHGLTGNFSDEEQKKLMVKYFARCYEVREMMPLFIDHIENDDIKDFLKTMFGNRNPTYSPNIKKESAILALNKENLAMFNMVINVTGANPEGILRNRIGDLGKELRMIVNRETHPKWVQEVSIFAGKAIAQSFAEEYKNQFNNA